MVWSKPKLGPRQARLARDLYEAGELTVAQIAAEFGVTRPTIYRHLGKLDQQLTTTSCKESVTSRGEPVAANHCSTAAQTPNLTLAR